MSDTNGSYHFDTNAIHGGHSVPCVDLSIEGKPRIRPSETPPVHTYHVRHIRLRKKNRVSAQECFEHNERQYLA